MDQGKGNRRGKGCHVRHHFEPHRVGFSIDTWRARRAMVNVSDLLECIFHGPGTFVDSWKSCCRRKYTGAFLEDK